MKWTHEVDGEASLAGNPPQVKADRDALLVAVRRNHGFELDRLDRADGKSLWLSDAVFLDADDVRLAPRRMPIPSVVVPVGNRLVAVCLRDGKCSWQAKLPNANGAGRWVVRVGRQCVIAYAESAVPREPVADVLGRLLHSFESEPAVWRLPGLALGAYDAWVARGVPVLLFDPETGKRLARFDIPAAGPAVTAYFERDLAVIATGDRVVWLR